MTIDQQLPETQLIERVVAGDIALFEVLIRRYNPYLYKVGRSYGFRHEDVEELMQDTFIHAYQGLRKLVLKEHFKTWLITIMLHECHRKNRRQSSKKEVVTDTFLY